MPRDTCNHNQYRQKHDSRSRARVRRDVQRIADHARREDAESKEVATISRIPAEEPRYRLIPVL